SDAVEALRRKLEDLRVGTATPADTPESGDSPANLTRLPRRPRRMTEQPAQPPRKTPPPRRTWHPDNASVYDPAPTRPVLRSELQRETGWWPVDPGATRHPSAPQPTDAEQDASVIDLDALRRKRTGADTPASPPRRIAKPRRIGPNTAADPSTAEQSRTDDDAPGSPRPDEPPRRS
ncbi:hypothetical protein, partial [Nocardia seriolae]